MNWKTLLLAAILVAATLLTAIYAVAAGEEEKQSLKCVWNVEADFPKTNNSEIDKAIEEWLTAHIDANLEAAKGYVFPPDPDFAWDMGVSYHLTRCGDKAVNIVFTTYTFPKGAAHPMHDVESLSFSLPDGKRLTLDDLFADPEKALAVFAEKSPDQIANIYAENNEEFTVESLREIMRNDMFGDGFNPLRDNYGVWSVEEEGLRIFFQVYQVLPYAFGLPEVLIPLEDLKAAGPNPKYWPGE